MSVGQRRTYGKERRHVVHADRAKDYESVADLAVPADVARDLERHVRAARKLALHGDALAEGAGHVAAVTALRLATMPALTVEDQEAKVAATDRCLASMGGAKHAHLASLLEAALWAEWRSRTAPGLRRLGGTTLAVDTHPDSVDGASASDLDVTTSDIVRYQAAVASADTDFALARTIDVVQDLRVLPRTSAAARGARAVLDEIAFGLCVGPSTSREDRLDKRRPLLILWRTVRRRPSTAAVLRRKILLDRRRWPGPVR